MGRHIKEGLSFFPMDVDFFDDEKLMFITARFGVKGDGIVTRLLCRIYRSGYSIKFDGDFALLFARSAGDSNLSGLVSEVVNELLKRGFFDEDIFKRFGILTSAGIQKRYARICTDSKRKGWEIPLELDLLRSKTVFTPDEMPKIQGDSTQSKVKESKVKDDDGKAPPSPPKPIPPMPGIDPYQSTEANKAIALSDRSMHGFIETHVRAGIGEDLLARWLDAFNRQLAYDGVTLKQQIDYRKHFARWLKFQPYTTGHPEDFSPVKAAKASKHGDQITSIKTGIKNL